MSNDKIMQQFSYNIKNKSKTNKHEKNNNFNVAADAFCTDGSVF